jgi:RNA polymerase sigma-70 factor (ECF subfamily)
VLSPEEQALLVESIRRGDLSAEERLIAAFERPVLCILKARTRDPEASRDLAQEALMAALAAVREGRLREAHRLAGFLAGTARNLALKHLRSRRRDPLPLEEAREPAAPPPAEDHEAAERVALVERALDRLDDREREVMRLTWLEGLEPREIASRLGLSGDVVRARKSRGLKKVIDYVRTRS